MISQEVRVRFETPLKDILVKNLEIVFHSNLKTGLKIANYLAENSRFLTLSE